MFKFSIYENVAKNIIFIDGIARSGKSLFSSIIPSLEDFELIQFFYLLEQVIPAVYLGSLNEGYAKALLRIQLNELAYNLLLSRNVNYRHKDTSGVLNYKEPAVYFERLSREDGDAVVEDLRGKKRFFPFITHDLMVTLETIERLEIDYKMIEFFRHPIDNCYSWWKRGWGIRYGNDPRAFTLCLNHKGSAVPWYCAGYEEEWLRLNPMERCVRTALDLISRSLAQYKSVRRKDHIHILTFEDFVCRPDRELKKICDFLGTAPTNHTAYFINRAKCPRVLESPERSRKLDEFKTGISKKIMDELINFSQSYDADLYGLRQS